MRKIPAGRERFTSESNRLNRFLNEQGEICFYKYVALICPITGIENRSACRTDDMNQLRVKYKGLIMKLKIKLFSDFKSNPKLGKNGGLHEIEIKNQASVEDVLHQLNIPVESPKIILVNGKHSRPGYTLKDGDTVSLFPPFSGG